MNRRLFILIFLALASLTCEAGLTRVPLQDTLVPSPEQGVEVQEVPPGKEQSSIDTTLQFILLPVTSDSMQSWKKNRSFAYAQYLDSLLQDLQNKKKPAKQASSSSPGFLDRLLASPVTRVVLWVLAGCFILFILYRLFLAQGVFQRNLSRKEELPLVEEEQLHADTDFDQLIGQAVRSGNYRLAVRYQYLKTLHRLAERGLLEMAADKTNYQYVNELKTEKMRTEFAALTLSYEYAWYGGFAIEPAVYTRLEQSFQSFNQTAG